MPKVIDDVEEKIICSALEVFGSNGYAKSDMKKIASGAGIAVGTLYNYFSNKKNLFKSVFSRSWDMTVEKIQAISYQDGESMEKIEKFIEVLYDDICLRKGLGRELARADIVSNEECSLIMDRVFEAVDSMFESYSGEKGTSIEKSKRCRLFHTIMSTCVLLARIYPDKRDENLSFILELVRKYLS